MERFEMESKNGRVGVFTRIYRNDETMHESIKSVLNQTYTNFKFYIMVNDNTKSILSDWKAKDSRIVLVDGGVNDGFRTCAKKIALENTYATTIDGDDWYDKKYLEHLVEQIEQKHVDMLACGNYFFSVQKGILGERKQVSMEWSKSDTSVVLPYIYAHFRTIWGKLIKSKVLLDADFDVLPESTQYGGYGGDTLFMFNLLAYAEKVAITDKSLYYYRVSESSGSYSLNPGRLDSDEIVFRFVENILQSIGYYGEIQKRWLFWCYGYALIDTTKLLLNAHFSDVEKVEKLLYIFGKPLTKELFDRECIGLLKINKFGDNERYALKLQDLIFSNLTLCETSEIKVAIFSLFEIIWPNFKGVLTEDQFAVLIKDRAILDAFVAKDYTTMLIACLNILQELEEREKQITLDMIRKFSVNLLLKNLSCDVEFVEKYLDIFIAIVTNNYEKVFDMLHVYFTDDQIPEDELVELWINVAAITEKESEFVLAKQFKVEMLGKQGKLSEAKDEYMELLELGIMDDNMTLLQNFFEFNE